MLNYQKVNRKSVNNNVQDKVAQKYVFQKKSLKCVEFRLNHMNIFDFGNFHWRIEIPAFSMQKNLVVVQNEGKY